MTQLSHLYDAVVKKLLLNNVIFKIIEHKPLFTMEDVLNTLEIKPEQMGKTIILSVLEYGLVAIVVPGQLKVDLVKVSKIISISRNQIKFAEKKDIEDLGISVGAVSPFFDCFSKVIVDESFLSQEMVYCGSGDLGKTISISVHDLINLTSAKVGDVVKR